MRISHFFILIIIALIFGFSSCQKAKQSPNFLFILVDDLGWKDLGCYGSEFYETPNIDRLASESVRFTNAYAACPVCSPTRASIMTGLYPTRVNITDWIPGDDPKNRNLLGTADSNQLALEEITLAEVLKEHGYKTFFAGKWHLGDTGYFPEDQGFDTNLGGHHRGSPPGGYFAPYKNPKLSDGPEGEHLTDRLTDESIRFIDENKEEKFLLYLSFYTVHTPIQAHPEYVDYYKNKSPEEQIRVPEHNAFTTVNQGNPAYASMVHSLDYNVGRLLKSLEEAGIDENTVVFFTSDNGGLSTIQHPNWTAPTAISPLRAGKGWCYEGGIRVPLIIKQAGIGAFETDEPAISMDFFPTILELADIDPSPDKTLDGYSLAPILEEKGTTGRQDLFWHYPHYHGSGWTPGAAIRSGKWKLIEFYETDIMELYDLENDPGETSNLAEEYPDKVSELHKRLLKMQSETGALYPTRN